MTGFTIVLEEREFPSDRLLNTRMEEFEPEVTEARDPDGRVFWRRVEPYRLSLRPFITELDSGLAPPAIPGAGGPIGAPWGSGPSDEVRFYTYLFTIWSGDWTRHSSRVFYSPFPLHFVAYYVARDSGVDANTVNTYAVSLRNLRVIDVSPTTDYPDGRVSTEHEGQRVDAASPLRGLGSSEGIGGAHFVEWTAWTTPAAEISPRRSLAGGLTTIERRMTLERHTVGRAVAFYRPFPEPPRREDSPEPAPRVEPPFEERVRNIAGQGDPSSVREAIREIERRMESLKKLQESLKEKMRQSGQ